MTRQTAITLLLRCLTDLDYTNPTWTGNLVNRQTKRGESPSVKVVCTCKGEGRHRVRGLWEPCTICGGKWLEPGTLAGRHGWVTLTRRTLLRGRGWVVVDDYTGRRIGTIETGIVQIHKALRCDACGGNGAFGNQRRCDRCAGSGWVEVPLQRLQAVRTRLSADATEYGFGDPVLVAMEKRERAGDFEQLGLALAALRLELPRAFRTVVRVYVEAVLEVEQLAAGSELRRQVGLGYLSRLMPEEIRVPSWAARNERRRRERLRKRQREETAA